MRVAPFQLLSVVAISTFLVLAAPSAQAQAPGECSSGFCGTPDMSGGGCGCGGCGCSILIANTDMGETYSTSDDFDEDGYEDDFDNCPFVANTAQLDRDGDGFGDVCDNAANVPNGDQIDTDGDGLGDAADEDKDGDAKLNTLDNCPLIPNPTQRDTNTDGEGDACDNDDDGDGVLDTADTCPKLAGQVDPNTLGCRGDEDLDHISDAFDNCEGKYNDDQSDIDKDGFGDVCDIDMDGDTVFNNLDNAPRVPNPDQVDADRDGVGDVADPEFCYVFLRSAPKDCLNPLDTFKVGGVAVVEGAEAEASVGDPVRFVIFANRMDMPIEYTWAITNRPTDSEATIVNPVGKVVSSVGSFEYKYQKAGFVAPSFAPDQAGEYVVKLEARLIFDDDSFQGGPRVATHAFPLRVEQSDTGASGCSATTPGALLPSALAVVFGLFLLRRRRR